MRGIQIRFGLPSCLALAGIVLVFLINASYSSAQNSQPANQQQRPRKVGATATPSPGQTNSTGEEVGEGDVVRTGSTAATVEVLSELNGNRKALSQAIANIGTSNGTPLYDAFARVADQVFRDPPPADVRGRRAVVALTDGVDSSSDSDYDEA